jgi:hypothetical protein
VFTSLLIRSSTGSGGFTFLHLRIENDWLAHCERWEHIPDGRVRNNCLRNTWKVHKALLAKRVSTSKPVYAAAMWSDTAPSNKDLVLDGLQGAGYKVCPAPLWQSNDRTSVPLLIRERQNLFERPPNVHNDQYVSKRSPDCVLQPGKLVGAVREDKSLNNDKGV